MDVNYGHFNVEVFISTSCIQLTHQTSRYHKKTSIIIQHFSFCVLAQTKSHRSAHHQTATLFPSCPWRDQVPSKARTSAAPANLQRAATLVSLWSMRTSATNRAQTPQNDFCSHQLWGDTMPPNCAALRFIFIYLYYTVRGRRLSCHLSCDHRRLWLPAL